MTLDHAKVTVGLHKREGQPQEEFETQDAAAMAPYLKEKIIEALNGAWQYNAEVRGISVKRIRK